ncbi:hypothetical protein VFPBJ_06773 [Purpureocillium lilacinum]|uniref:Uncharacterized protein n=1 Tax=Purpureocillium lilacinum TaxID=33203 RepID=A0A179GLH9_PURLI|nr:hypothetical protein VFPBJ_06773 [Purpureocillium lilacinum]
MILILEPREPRDGGAAGDRGGLAGSIWTRRFPDDDGISRSRHCGPHEARRPAVRQAGRRDRDRQGRRQGKPGGVGVPFSMGSCSIGSK